MAPCARKGQRPFDLLGFGYRTTALAACFSTPAARSTTDRGAWAPRALPVIFTWFHVWLRRSVLARDRTPNPSA